MRIRNRARCRATCQAPIRFVDEFAKRHGVPVDATLGGPKTMYPEYQKELSDWYKNGGQVMSAQFKIGRVVFPAAGCGSHRIRRAPPDVFARRAAAGTLADPARLQRRRPRRRARVLRVQNNVYAIFGAGGNITVQIGEQGPLLVDSGLAGTSEKILAAVKTFPTSRSATSSIRTSTRITSAATRCSRPRGGFVSGGTTGGGRRDATLYSHENVLLRMSGALGKEKPLDTGLWPGNTFFNEKKELYLNGEAIEMLASACRPHRRRRDRVLPAVRRDFDRRHFRHDYSSRWSIAPGAERSTASSPR